MTRAIASTLFGAACLSLMACSTSDSGGGGGNGSSSGSSSSSSSGGSGPKTIPVMFDFGTTNPALNGGKGQVVNAHVGDTVVWKNDDLCTGDADAGGCANMQGTMQFHNVIGCVDAKNGVCGTTDAGAWAMYSGTAANGDATNPPIIGQYTFTAPGTYQYECGIHLQMMIGQVVVTP